jgi:hypothetical protein
MPDTSDTAGAAVQFDIRRLQRLRNAGGGTDNRTFDINSYNWSYENDLRMINKEGVQKMIIYEFQPDPIYDIGKVIDGAFGSWGKIYGDKNVESVTTDATSWLGGFMTGIVAGAAQGFLAPATEQFLMKQYYDNPQNAIQFPMNLIKKLFPGVYLNTFEMPYFDELYLDSAPDRGTWTMGGSERVLGKAAKKFVTEMMNIDFPTAPSWEHSIQSGKGFNMKNKFYLINDTTDNLVKNFKFLNALMSGTYWIQLMVMQKSPNLYKVVVPGRFTKWFCDISATVTMDGKLRTNPSAVGKINGGQTNVASSAGTNFDASFKSIQSTTLFPDVYKVELGITDLTPNHFNQYMDYMVNGDTVNVSGQTVEREITNPLSFIDKDFNSISSIADAYKKKAPSFIGGGQ